jgi:hypothetical protein
MKRDFPPGEKDEKRHGDDLLPKTEAQESI